MFFVNYKEWNVEFLKKTMSEYEKKEFYEWIVIYYRNLTSKNAINETNWEFLNNFFAESKKNNEAYVLSNSSFQNRFEILVVKKDSIAYDNALNFLDDIINNSILDYQIYENKKQLFFEKGIDFNRESISFAFENRFDILLENNRKFDDEANIIKDYILELKNLDSKILGDIYKKIVYQDYHQEFNEKVFNKSINSIGDENFIKLIKNIFQFKIDTYQEKLEKEGQKTFW